MISYKHVALACLLLAGCDGSPFVESPVDPGPTDPTDPAYPEQLKGSIGEVSLNGDALSVTLIPFDGPSEVANFRRDETRDISGYKAFEPVQVAGLGRNYLAYVAEIDGSVAVVVSDGGRGVDAFGGTSILSSGTFVAPTTGLATYSGEYVGLRTRGDGSVTALDADVITGNVEVNADFVNDRVEGSISNRINTRAGLSDEERVLDDRFMKVTTIGDNGTFAGEMTTADDSDVGSYFGSFAANGQSVVGAVAIDDGILDGVEDDVTEYGVFALPCAADDPTASVCP